MMTEQGKMRGTQSSLNISTKLLRIAELARIKPNDALTALAHYIDIDWLKEAYRRTAKNKATGVDGVTAKAYEKNLEANLQSLLNALKSGTYKAPPVRRVEIPKSGGGFRPIGIPTFEDKVLQRAVAMVLEAVYEQEFLGCSHGFRPKRGAHGALDALFVQATIMAGGFVLEVDIKSFFDALNHQKLRQILDQRIQDGVLRKAIDKWLAAGVMQAGEVRKPDSGTPQGGVVSPLLANVYLHEVLDKWFDAEVKPRMRGRAFMVRYADDVVMVFQQRSDAERVKEALRKRLERFGLTLHPDKTKLVAFMRPSKNADSNGNTHFDFLGFRHIWSRARNKKWVIKRKTAPARFRAALLRLSEWMKTSMHEKFAMQHYWLVQKLRGHYGYYGITGNSQSLKDFAHQARRLWFKRLSHRSQRSLTWERFARMLKARPLPLPIAVHSVLRGAPRMI
jgi:RNA-directed DNA polymerase